MEGVRTLGRRPRSTAIRPKTTSRTAHMMKPLGDHPVLTSAVDRPDGAALAAIGVVVVVVDVVLDVLVVVVVLGVVVVVVVDPGTVVVVVVLVVVVVVVVVGAATTQAMPPGTSVESAENVNCTFQYLSTSLADVPGLLQAIPKLYVPGGM